jgi:hypothetical protein
MLRPVALGLGFGACGYACARSLCDVSATRQSREAEKKRRRKSRRRSQRRQQMNALAAEESEADPAEPPGEQPRRQQLLPASSTPWDSSASSSSEDEGVGSLVPMATPRGAIGSPARRGKLSPGSLSRERTLLEDVLRRVEAEHGEDQPRSLKSKWNLADLLQSGYGDLEGACELAEECVAAATRNPRMGIDHADTQVYVASLHEWQSLQRKVAAGVLQFDGPWSPSKQECWVAPA